MLTTVSESPVSVPPRTAPPRIATEYTIPAEPQPETLKRPRGVQGDGASSSEEVDEDPLVEVARGAPLAKMLGSTSRRASRTTGATPPERPVKYLRLGGPEYARLAALSERERERSSTHSGEEEEEEVNDPVLAGLCTPARGQDLLDAFYAHCHNSIPVFDPATDTWDGLRARSPFALTAAMMVGAKFMNESPEERRLQEHAERMAKDTLFAPMRDDVDLETVQAMIILTAWGSAGWKTGGHALRLAMEQHLYRCLPHLVRTGMGRGKSGAALEAERPLVVGARVWLAVCKAEYE